MMKRNRKTILFAAALGVLAVIFIGSGHVLHKAAERRLLGILNSYGFEDAVIGTLALGPQGAAGTDIALDKDKFSTIRGLRYSGIWPGFGPRSVIIDGLNLVADYSHETGFEIAGWRKTPFAAPAFDEITLNGGRIDIDTPTDGVRFEAKGAGTRQENGAMKIQAAVWGIQNQIRIESRWDAALYPDGHWNATADFENGAINLANIQGSRISGWASIDKAQAAIPVMNAQVDAGKITIGALTFMNANLAFEGSPASYKLVAKGAVGGFQGMTATLDMNSAGPKDLQIKAVVETASLDDLLSFLSALQKTDQASGRLTSLLLTPGNIERLRKSIGQFSYDDLELEIYGTRHDLAGKITARTFKDGAAQKNVISLDPG